MKEYWVNVYPTGLGVTNWPSREAAFCAPYATKILYRIHVKMKEPYRYNIISPEFTSRNYSQAEV